MSKRYQKRPSEILGIEDLYVSYCLDEALDEYLKQIESGKKPIFKGDRKTKRDNPGLQLLIGSKKK